MPVQGLLCRFINVLVVKGSAESAEANLKKSFKIKIDNVGAQFLACPLGVSEKMPHPQH
jgi:hypothetical protein